MTTDGIPTRLLRLRNVARGRRRAAVVIYGNPDPDALGSAWALRRILGKWHVPASVVYTGEVGRLENEAMIEFLRIPASRPRPGEIERADLVALVDAQPSFFPPGALRRCDIVFDHHPRRGPGGGAFTDIRPACLATSSILTEYFAAARCRLDRRIATALFYGIVTDARHQDRARSAVDASALERLETRVDRKTVRRIEFSAYSLARLDYFAIAIMRLRHHRGMLCANLGPVPSGDVCAQIADFLVRVKEVRWVVVVGVHDDVLVVVFRSDVRYGNAGRMAQAAFGRFGSAGGHETMGRAEIRADALPQGILLTQGERIERFVLERLARASQAFRPLLRELISQGPA